VAAPSWLRPRRRPETQHLAQRFNGRWHSGLARFDRSRRVRLLVSPPHSRSQAHTRFNSNNSSNNNNSSHNCHIKHNSNITTTIIICNSSNNKAGQPLHSPYRRALRALTITTCITWRRHRCTPLRRRRLTVFQQDSATVASRRQRICSALEARRPLALRQCSLADRLGAALGAPAGSFGV